MNLALWVSQGWLAVIFAIAGSIKLARSRASLEQMAGMAYVAERTSLEMKLIGLAEILGALGLVLPWWLDIAPVLTLVAAAALATLMTGAVHTHRRRSEPALLPTVLLLLALFVTAGRFGGLG